MHAWPCCWVAKECLTLYEPGLKRPSCSQSQVWETPATFLGVFLSQCLQACLRVRSRTWQRQSAPLFVSYLDPQGTGEVFRPSQVLEFHSLFSVDGWMLSRGFLPAFSSLGSGGSFTVLWIPVFLPELKLRVGLYALFCYFQVAKSC